ncbi:MAG: thioredoxin family protein [Parashewanella sp.]
MQQIILETIFMLTGKLTSSQLNNELSQYPDYDDNYQVDSASLQNLVTLTKQLNIVVIVGTWCPDCHRDIPRFMSVIEEINNDNIQVEYLAVDKQKTDPQGLAARYSFERIPTYIVLHENNEIGRIVERPAISLEKDLIEIINKLK